MPIQKFSGVFLAALAMSGAMAQTKAPEPDYTLGFNVGVVTDYRYRGITQSRFDPALQGGVDFAHKSGLYLGAWASSIKWIKDAGGDASAEIDFYGGYKGSAGDLGFDVGVLRYQYPGHSLVVSPNTTEVYGALTYGAVTAKYSHSVTNLFGFANSSGSGYLDLSAIFDLGKGFSIVPHFGHQRVSGTGNGIFSYTDYSLALNYDFGSGLTGSLAAVGSDAKKTSYFTPSGKASGRDGVVLGLKYSF